ncbi:MAG TPA: MFS transporter [Jatrophihabitantaceae bacterium]|jgi:sugar phosphate permease
MTAQRRWTILAVGTFAQAATCSFLYGMPMLVPALRSRGGLSLLQASLLVSAPIVGLLFTLILWGALADRYGERVVIASGVGAAAALLAVVPTVSGVAGEGVLLVLAGACAASVNAASGRVVMGWFPVHERGLAMGTRQTAQPLGVALAALVLPGLARSHGAAPALLFPAGLCALATVLVLVLVADPPRPPRATGVEAASPYRGSWTLPRVHLSSAMLVVPQFAVATFTLAYLVGQRHWDPAVAGRWIFGFQAAGALGRIVAGVWSDRVASRLRPMRQLAVTSAALMLLIALGALVHQGWIVVGFALGAVVTVADNGLAYTSVAELAGPAWSGRALGAQNTVQNIAAVVTAPVLAAVIGDSRYALAFVVAAVCPLIAIPLTPVRAERARSFAR